MPKQSSYRKGSLVLLFLFFILGSKMSFAQSDSQITIDKVKELHRLADSAYGSSHELVNGELYYQANLYALETPFYLSEDWLEGSVTINGKKHEGVFLKYNIETDQLILRPTIKNGMSSAIVLNPPFVESFQLEDHLFINSEKFGSGEFKTNYLNDVYTGTFDFLATYKVVFVNDYNTKTPYGKYSAISNSYFIHSKKGTVSISSKKALMDYFKDYKKEINKYMKNEKMRFGKANSKQWNGLMETIDNLITASTK